MLRTDGEINQQARVTRRAIDLHAPCGSHGHANRCRFGFVSQQTDTRRTKRTVAIEPVELGQHARLDRKSVV